MHLVGFIIRIYRDARSPERQIQETLELLHPIRKYKVLRLWTLWFVLLNL